jgi:superfamily II DNA helicase RecQ
MQRNALWRFRRTDVGQMRQCDNCTAPAVGGTPWRRRTSQRLVLECAAELGGKFGKTTLIDGLQGESTKRIAQYKLYEAVTYGAANAR